MKYLYDTLKISTQYYEWDKNNRLPLYIRDNFDIKKVTLNRREVIFLYPAGKLEQLSQIKKIYKQIKELDDLEIVLILTSISKKQKKYLIEHSIAFIVQDNQIYLPFLGFLLQEEIKQESSTIDRLQPSAQLLLFYFIYQNQTVLYTNEAVKYLNFSAMTISRATKQLQATGLFKVDKVSGYKVIVSDILGAKLFEKAKRFLINPVQKTIYIANENVTKEMLPAGDMALAEKSLLNYSTLKCLAIESKKLKGSVISEDFYSLQLQSRLQLWKYNPALLSESKNEVDILSLALSFLNDNDERIEEAIDQMLHDLWSDLDGHRTNRI